MAVAGGAASASLKRGSQIKQHSPLEVVHSEAGCARLSFYQHSAIVNIVHSDTSTTIASTAKSLHLPEIIAQGIAMAANAKPHPNGWQGSTKTRATPIIRLHQNTDLSDRLAELAASRAEVYDAAITALGTAASDVELQQQAQAGAEEYAAELGNKAPVLPTAKQMLRHLPSKFDLGGLLTNWNKDGTTQPVGAVLVQQAALADAIDGWCKRWDAIRAAKQKQHSTARRNTGLLGRHIVCPQSLLYKDSKGKLKYRQPFRLRRADAALAAKDPYDYTDLLLAGRDGEDGRLRSVKCYQSLTGFTASYRPNSCGWRLDDDGRQIFRLQIGAAYELMVKKNIVGLASLEQHNTPDTPNSQRLGIRAWQAVETRPGEWCLRLLINVPVPEQIDVSAISDDMAIGIDRGVAVHAATSQPVAIYGRQPTRLHSAGIDIRRLASLYKLLRLTPRSARQRTGTRKDKHAARDLTSQKEEYQRLRAAASPADIQLAITIASTLLLIDKCRAGSSQHTTAKAKIRKLYGRLAGRAEHWAANLANEIADNYTAIFSEDLALANMLASAKGTAKQHGKNVKAKTGLNRAMSRAQAGRVASHIDRQAERTGSHCHQIPPAYTSQTCSKCGVIDGDSRQSQSEWVCAGCGYETNADVNAAVNVAAKGMAGLRQPAKPAKKSKTKTKSKSQPTAEAKKGGAAPRLKGLASQPTAKADGSHANGGGDKHRHMLDGDKPETAPANPEKISNQTTGTNSQGGSHQAKTEIDISQAGSNNARGDVAGRADTSKINDAGG